MPDPDTIQISVIVTFHNQKAFIAKCLSSVLNQKTDFPFEILCGDDCSSDGTYEELLVWVNKYPGIIRVYRTDSKSLESKEPIVRASNNRYNLLTHAKGRFICFLDGDDYYCDDYKLQKQYNVLDNDPSLSCCFHPLILRWADGNHSDKVISDYSETAFVMPVKTYWGFLWSHVETFLFRNTYKDISGDLNKDFFDDNLITAYFIRGGRIMYIPDPMCVYMQFDQSSWNKRNEQEKTYINLLVYQEAKKVMPEMRFYCFTKCYDYIRFLYDNRREDWNVEMDSKMVLMESLYIDTVRFKDSDAWYKFLYIAKWSFPMYFGKLLKRVLYRFSKCTWKRI